MIKFSISNAFRRKSITFLAILGAALGAGLMTVLLSLSSGMNAKLNSTLDKVAGDVLVSSKDASVIGGFIGGGTPIPESYVTEIRGMDKVKTAQPVISTIIPKEILKTLSPVGSPFQGVDINQNKETGGALAHITEGRGIENSYEVVVGESIVSQMESMGEALKVGDTIKVPIFNMSQGSSGASAQSLAQAPVKDFHVVGFFKTDNQINDMSVVASIKDLREVTGIPADKINSIRVTATSSDYVNEVSDEILQRYEGSDYPIQASVSKDLLGDINTTMDIFRNFLLIISAVAAVAGGTSIMIIMLMSVIERMQEFGILKAAGWANASIISSVFIESLTLAVLGSFIGLGFGYLLGKVIDSRLGEQLALLTPAIGGGVVVFGIIMGLVGGLYPAVRAARVSPIDTLKSS